MNPDASIAAAPDFAPAFAGLAAALPTMHLLNGLPPVDAMPEAKAAARRALDLDNGLGQAHTAYGSLLCLYDWNWREAEKELKKGLELDRNNPLAHDWYAVYLQSVGHPEEALAEVKRAQELDPLSFLMNRELARGYYLVGKYDEALEQLRRSEELEPQSKWVVRNWIAWIYELQGKHKEAVDLDLSNMADEGVPKAEVSSLRNTYKKDGWRRYWSKWIQLDSTLLRYRDRSPYERALAEARLGRADKAWEWMAKSADQKEVWAVWIRVDTLLESARSHPAYKQLLQRINLPIDQ